MKPTSPLFASPFFQFSSASELVRAVDGYIDLVETAQIYDLAERHLPPITSRNTLSAMLGINPGIIWSFQHNPRRHYRIFEIRSGRKTRAISAPKKALKVVQQWLAHHLQQSAALPAHVFGFVPGRSHIDAASVHLNASWVFSVDIRNFFPSTPAVLVHYALRDLGYSDDAATLISSLVCLGGVLPQGAPTSPVLSNLCFKGVDEKLAGLAKQYGARLSRYADDIVFSGDGTLPTGLPTDMANLFAKGPWRLAEEKTEAMQLPKRLKVHGLLVHGEVVRLTKGYRNRVRALKHLHDSGKILPEKLAETLGHLEYARYVEMRGGTVMRRETGNPD